MRWLLATALLLGACYSPEYSDDTLCSGAGECPPGRTCVEGMCRVVGSRPPDAPIPTGIDAATPTSDAPVAPDAPPGAADAPPSPDACAPVDESVACAGLCTGAQVPDGCGGLITCGADRCATGDVCSGTACCTPVARTIACAGSCGDVMRGDGCGGTYVCAGTENCPVGEPCVNDVCCTPTQTGAQLCLAAGAVCGVLPQLNSCGQQVSCGSCDVGEVCTGGACCTPLTQQEACADRCGGATVGDGCGRTYTCPATQYCSPTTCTGSSCICNTSRSCVSCSAGQACTTNPSRECFDGQISCATGAPVCVDGTPKAGGTSCGTGKVCNGTGSCVPCATGDACVSNPNAECRSGVISCTTGSPVCQDSTPRPPGTTCGTNEVCDGAGGCGACTAGASCTTNPGAECRLGVVSCSTGAPVCGDGAAVAAGTPCGTNEVCNPSGTCISCTAGASCASNPNGACAFGVTSCATGALTCVDGTLKPAGTPCGTGQVCTSGGACGSCTAGQSCSTNPNSACFNGVTSCATGSQTCVDGTQKQTGTSCGTNMVCTAAGTCVSCTAGTSCSTHPGGECVNGVTSCATGAAVCVNGTNKMDGTGCGSSSTTGCDAADTCVAGVCRNNVKTGGTVCRAESPSGACDVAETCDGVSAACPGDGVRGSSHICRAAGASATCDPAETCDGVNKTCPPNVVASQGTGCGSSNASDCDAADACDSAGVCVNRVKAGGTLCRPPADLCDAAEECTGSSPTCPGDGVAPSGTTCRGAGSNAICDPAETCSGSSKSCPANVVAAANTVCGPETQCSSGSVCVPPSFSLRRCNALGTCVPSSGVCSCGSSGQGRCCEEGMCAADGDCN